MGSQNHMLEIVMILVTLLLLAKHPRKKRRFRRYLRGEIDLDNALGTLSAGTLLSATVGGSVIERTFVSSIVCSWALQGFTNIVGDGPVTVGVAHSDYTDAEIQEVITNAGSWTEGNQISQERSRRKVKIVGTFRQPGDAAEVAQTVVLNEGKLIKTKLNWILVTGQNLKLWAFNTGGSPLTTGSTVFTMGHANLWPQ